MSFVYKGLKANFEKLTVTEHELDRQMDRLRQQTPRVIPVTERAAKMGDDVVLDYAGFVDGKQFEGGTAKSRFSRSAAACSSPASSRSSSARMPAATCSSP